MSKTQAIVFDVDGVLADFAYGFSSLRAELYDPNQPIISKYQYETWEELGPSHSEANKRTWTAIWGSCQFWLNLPPLQDGEAFNRIQRLCEKHNVYFATNRGVTDVKKQTEHWLMFYGIDQPTVIITKYKGEFCKAVDARMAIDDKSDNASAISWLSPRTIPFLLDYPFNRYDETKIGSNRVVRVDKLGKFLDQCETL